MSFILYIRLLLTLYIAFIFSLWASRFQGQGEVAGGLMRVLQCTHSLPQIYESLVHCCVSQSALGCSLNKSVNFWMKPLETDVEINLENAFFWGSKNVPYLCNSPGSRHLFFQNDLITQLQRLTFFTIHVQKIPWPLAIPAASHVWGLPFESKLFVEKHYLSGNSSVKTWWNHCYSGDHLSPLEDKTC